MNIKLYLIRHGESVQNSKPDFIGQEPDEPLSELGELQAQKLGKYFESKRIMFDEIYCSNYHRAKQTYWEAIDEPERQLSFNNTVAFVPALREYDAGDMKGAKRSEVLTPEVVAKMQSLGMAFKFPNGESLFEVQQRVLTWLYDNVLSVPSDKDRNIALFSHGMTIKCLLQHFLQFDQHMAWRIAIDNTSMSILEFKNNMWFLNCINGTPHLK